MHLPVTFVVKHLQARLLSYKVSSLYATCCHSFAGPLGPASIRNQFPRSSAASAAAASSSSRLSLLDDDDDRLL